MYCPSSFNRQKGEKEYLFIDIRTENRYFKDSVSCPVGAPLYSSEGAFFIDRQSIHCYAF